MSFLWKGMTLLWKWLQWSHKHLPREYGAGISKIDEIHERGNQICEKEGRAAAKLSWTKSQPSLKSPRRTGTLLEKLLPNRAQHSWEITRILRNHLNFPLDSHARKMGDIFLQESGKSRKAGAIFHETSQVCGTEINLHRKSSGSRETRAIFYRTSGNLAKPPLFFARNPGVLVKSMRVFTRYTFLATPRHNFAKFALEAGKLEITAISGPNSVGKRYKTPRLCQNRRRVDKQPQETQNFVMKEKIEIPTTDKEHAQCLDWIDIWGNSDNSFDNDGLL